MIETALQRIDPARILQILRDASWSTLGLLFFSSAAAILLIGLIISEISRLRARLPRIPGPTGLPVVGNLHQLSPDPAEQFRKWSQKYGSVYQVTLGNMPVIVFNSMHAVKDVFIGQGGALVDRPQFYTYHGKLSSKAASIGGTPWSESTKITRKAAAKAMNRPAVATYIPLIDELSRELVADLFKNGKAGEIAFDPKPLLQNSILDLTMTLNYGARLPKDSFDELTLVEHNVSRLRGPIGSPADYLPILRWSPVNSRSAFAKETGRRRLVYLNRFNRELEERINHGKEKSSIQANVLKDPEAKLNDIELLSVSMSMISGGLDTMVHTLAWTIGDLARRPRVQDAAYAAICDAYSKDSWGDLEENGVPYISALVKECLRYFAVLRLSLPRAAWRDIYYNGMHIPKGTTVVLNVWGCNMDKEVYGEDADQFRPERFLEGEVATGLEHATYGLGTRMCAGTHLANRQLYIILLRLLWAFRIELSTDPRENSWTMRPIEDSTEPFHLAAIPPRYNVRFVPRNQTALQNILESEKA